MSTGRTTATPRTMIGAFGTWAAGLTGPEPPTQSFRSDRWTDVDEWREAARRRLLERIAQPECGGRPDARVHRQFTYDGLHVEELEWHLPYGPPTRALFLKPAGAHGPLPAVLALHDHGGNHYFGRRKIARTSDRPHPDMVRHQELAYGGVGWANQIARRGYAVLVHDAFSFASRRVLAADLPGYAVHSITGRVSRIADVDPTEWHGMDTSAWTVSEQEPAEEIEAYNRFAGPLENLIAKSLFCAGTTWPGVFSVEDQRALDYLCARDDVDPNRVGCGGLSGGGLRTVFLAGLDDRIRCAVCVGFMTTWRDFLLNKCFVHTWMAYVPLLPRELDFPDILSLRAPLPTMVLNTRQDELYTLAEMQAADETLRAVYRKAGMPERYRCSFYDGPHKFDLPMQDEAFAWFDRWLKT
jgi:dienelactone hydrolase